MTDPARANRKELLEELTALLEECEREVAQAESGRADAEDSPKKDEPWKKFQGSGAPAPPTAPQATGPRRSAWQTRLASDKDKK